MEYTALLDANVLHPMVLCDLLIRLARRELYRAKWSTDILKETARSIIRARPEIPESRILHRIELMKLAVPDAEVTGYEKLAAELSTTLSDGHVIAAAIIGRADVIVTYNTKDFPAAVLSPYGLITQTPDEFLIHQLSLQPDTVRDALAEMAASTKRPPLTVPQVLERLDQRVPDFVQNVRGIEARRLSGRHRNAED